MAAVNSDGGGVVVEPHRDAAEGRRASGRELADKEPPDGADGDVRVLEAEAETGLANKLRLEIVAARTTEKSRRWGERSRKSGAVYANTSPAQHASVAQRL